MPDQSFVMVGPPSGTDPSNLPELEASMARLPNLRWMGSVSFEDTARLFEEALVFVNTSQAEGFPNTFLQAAACGTPIVSWAVDPEGILERFEMGSCAHRNWTRFEHMVRLLCVDDELRIKLGENGRSYVRKYHDSGAVVGQYLELFLTLRERGDTSLARPASTSVRSDAANPINRMDPSS